MTLDHADHLEGYEVPVHVSLTQAPLFAGVPRELGILTVVFTLLLTVGFRMWGIGLVSGLIIHSMGVGLTRHDPHWFAVFWSHLKTPSFMDA